MPNTGIKPATYDHQIGASSNEDTQWPKSYHYLLYSVPCFQPPPYLNNSVFNQKFELKMLPNSNRSSVFKHSGWEPKIAEWSRKALQRLISRERKELREDETHSADRFLIKEEVNCPARFTSKEERA